MPVLILPSGHAAPAAAGFPAVKVEFQFTPGTWADVSAFYDSGGGAQIVITRGSSRVESPVVRYDAGTCVIPLSNADRRFDPANLAGPYVAGGQTQVLPMVPVRVSATYAGVTYRLFTGTVDSWQIGYSPPSDSVASVSCTDGFKVLGALIRAGRAVYHGPGEDSGARVNRILDDAGWPAANRSVTPGDATLQATLLGFAAVTVIGVLMPMAGSPALPLAGSGTNTPDYAVVTGGAVLAAAQPSQVQVSQSSGTPLDELQLTAETEMGELYVDGNGFVVFRRRSALFTDTRSKVPQAVFGDA